MSDSSNHQSSAAVCEYHRSSHFIQTTNNCLCCFVSVRGDATDTRVENSQTDGTTTARFKDEWVSRWVDECKSASCSVLMSACEYIYIYINTHTVQFVRWRRRATAGSDRFWSSGCQNLQPQHVRQRWEPVPAGRTAGLLTCWCRTGTNRCHQTPEREREREM